MDEASLGAWLMHLADHLEDAMRGYAVEFREMTPLVGVLNPSSTRVCLRTRRAHVVTHTDARVRARAANASRLSAPTP